MLKILYCSYSEIPSKSANSIAVMKQCFALSKRVRLRAILVKGRNKEKKNVFNEYGVEAFPLILLPRQSLFFKEFGLRLFVLLYALLSRPDIVYSRDILINELLCHFHIRNIYEMHQIDQEDDLFDKLFKKSLASILDCKELEKIVCISKSLAEKCESFGVPKDKLFVMHSGIDLRECIETEKAMRPIFPQSRPLAVYVGSLKRGKGIDVIMELSKLTSNFNFLIVGGEKGQIIERDNLRHIPHVDHKTALSLMKMADYLLLPLNNQKYKFHSPLKLFEYLSMGKPVIASDSVDIREIITNMENGMLAEMDNADDFLGKMNLVASQEALKNKIKRNAVSSIEQFTWEARADKIVKISRRE